MAFMFPQDCVGSSSSLLSIWLIYFIKLRNSNRHIPPTIELFFGVQKNYLLYYPSAVALIFPSVQMCLVLLEFQYSHCDIVLHQCPTPTSSLQGIVQKAEIPHSLCACLFLLILLLVMLSGFSGAVSSHVLPSLQSLQHK